MQVSHSETNQTININRLHFPVSTLGFGQRVAIWLQGCSLQCPGCISRDTWVHGHGNVAFKALKNNLEHWLLQSDGLTVSGGEPFEQPIALERLLSWWREHHKGDILVFSGLSSEQIERHHSRILALIDVLISDPYQEEADHTLALRGSDNQRMHLLTPLAAQRYRVLPRDRALDICWDGDRVWMAGIPNPADLRELHRRLEAQGVLFQSSDQPFVEVLP